MYLKAHHRSRRKASQTAIIPTFRRLVQIELLHPNHNLKQNPPKDHHHDQSHQHRRLPRLREGPPARGQRSPISYARPQRVRHPSARRRHQSGRVRQTSSHDNHYSAKETPADTNPSFILQDQTIPFPLPSPYILGTYNEPQNPTAQPPRCPSHPTTAYPLTNLIRLLQATTSPAPSSPPPTPPTPPGPASSGSPRPSTRKTRPPPRSSSTSSSRRR